MSVYVYLCVFVCGWVRVCLYACVCERERKRKRERERERERETPVISLTEYELNIPKD